MTELDEQPLPPAPAPDPGFRGALGRRLAGEGVPPSRPQRLWWWVGGLAAGGTILLVAAAAGI